MARRVPDEVRAAVLADLLAGKPISEIAKTHGVDRKTIYKWRSHDPRFGAIASEVSTAIATRPPPPELPPIGDMVQALLYESLQTLTAHQKYFRDPGFLARSSAADLAALNQTVWDNTARLLAAIASASGRGNPDCGEIVDVDAEADNL